MLESKKSMSFAQWGVIGHIANAAHHAAQQAAEFAKRKAQEIAEQARRAAEQKAQELRQTFENTKNAVENSLSHAAKTVLSLQKNILIILSWFSFELFLFRTFLRLGFQTFFLGMLWREQNFLRFLYTNRDILQR